MYYPFLRGRAAELRALDGCERILKDGFVSPILDPCDPTKEWWAKLRRFNKRGIPISVIINPENGKFRKDSASLRTAIDTELDKDTVVPAYHVRDGVSSSNVASFLDHYKDRPASLILASDGIPQLEFEKILDGRDNLEFMAIATRLPTAYVPRTDAPVVVIEDAFKPAPANAKYPPERFFSELSITYAEEGFAGFGDYTTLGQAYTPGGFIPKAVAIHLTYESKPGVIRVRHFVSEDRKEQVHGLVPKKTKQALDQLVQFVRETGVFCGDGCLSFISAAHADPMPQLAALKQWSIQHHIELMNHVLSREDQP